MSLRVGELAPHSIEMAITPGTSDVDLSTVTGVTFHVQKPDGTQVTWVATASNQTSTTLTATYVLNAGTTDIDQAGQWALYVLMTVPGGVIRTDVAIETVKGEFEA